MDIDEQVISFLSGFTEKAAAYGVATPEKQVQLLKIVAGMQLEKGAQFNSPLYSSYPRYMERGAPEGMGPTMGSPSQDTGAAGRLATAESRRKEVANMNPVGRFFAKLKDRFAGPTGTSTMDDLMMLARTNPEILARIVGSRASEMNQQLGAIRNMSNFA